MNRTDKLVKELQETAEKVGANERDIYYTRQIIGLILIIEQSPGIVSRSYIVEKLNMILNGGIGFHSSILEKL